MVLITSTLINQKMLAIVNVGKMSTKFTVNQRHLDQNKARTKAKYICYSYQNEYVYSSESLFGGVIVHCSHFPNISIGYISVK